MWCRREVDESGRGCDEGWVYGMTFDDIDAVRVYEQNCVLLHNSWFWAQCRTELQWNVLKRAERNCTHNLNLIHFVAATGMSFHSLLAHYTDVIFYCISSGFSDWQIHKKLIPYISIRAYLQFFSFLLTLWTIREKWWSHRVQNNLKSEEKDGLGKSKKVSLPRRMFLGIIPIPFFLPILLPLQVR